MKRFLYKTVILAAALLLSSPVGAVNGAAPEDIKEIHIAYTTQTAGQLLPCVT